MGLLDYMRGYRLIGPEAFALNPDNWTWLQPDPQQAVSAPAVGLDPLGTPPTLTPPYLGAVFRGLGGGEDSGWQLGSPPPTGEFDPLGIPGTSTRPYLGAVFQKLRNDDPGPQPAALPVAPEDFPLFGANSFSSAPQATLSASIGATSSGSTAIAPVLLGNFPPYLSDVGGGLWNDQIARENNSEPFRDATLPSRQSVSQLLSNFWDALNPISSAQAHEAEGAPNIAAALRARVASGKLSPQEAARIEGGVQSLDRWTQDAIAARTRIDGDAPNVGPSVPSEVPSGPNRLGPGPYAPPGGGVSLSKPLVYPNPKERAQVNQLGTQFGCHTCGTKDFGTRSGNPIVDHQPPRVLNRSGAPAEGYPHCATCSARQGGLLSGIGKYLGVYLGFKSASGSN
ncbi:MAG TPA: hypothetical protein VFA50_13280 [Stellaceae bacterium]|nr:hypothetical protein [Stellaceae bacterium]